MPMHRWMHSAAGGTSQRLKPGLAMIRSLESSAGPASPTLTVLAMSFPSPEDPFLPAAYSRRAYIFLAMGLPSRSTDLVKGPR